MSDQTEVPNHDDQAPAQSESELDREFMEILTTGTPAELKLLVSLMRAEAYRIGLSLG